MEGGIIVDWTNMDWGGLTSAKILLIGSLHTRHFCSQYSDIAIKRYCDKKTFLNPVFQD